MKKYVLRAMLVSLIMGLAMVSCEEENFDPDSLEDTWTCDENSEAFGPQTFTVDIVSTGTNTYRVVNFANLGFDAEANIVLNGSNISIPNQTVSGFVISGSGTFTSSKRLNLAYSIDGDNATAVFTR